MNDKNTLIFKKKINNIITYIKLKIELDENEEVVVCLSFHNDKKKKRKEYEMSNM
jgi:hypothetical protein